jgi:hypothetical protein
MLTAILILLEWLSSIFIVLACYGFKVTEKRVMGGHAVFLFMLIISYIIAGDKTWHP